MHRARAARPRAFDSLPSQDLDPGRCDSYSSAGSSKIKIRTSLAYRGFIPKPGGTLGYNIIVVSHLLYGLKRCSGTFGSILDLKEGVVH
jgi:hypothetical protein